MSLKTKLHTLLKNNGYISLQELENFCHQEHYKLATAERILRPSESPLIQRVMKSGAIIGYSYGKKKGCCSEMDSFGQHFSPCKNQSKIEENNDSGKLF